MITKFASLESAQVLELKGSKDHKTASLDKLSDFEDYRTEDGYLYARIRAISSRVNKNNDGWPSVELAGSPAIFSKHQASEGFVVQAKKGEKYGFSTFLGKPVFVDHNNSNPSRARGVIVDAKLHVEDHKTAASLDPYYSSAPDNHMPPTWVELLLEVDAKSFPKLAQAIIEGSKDSKKGIDGFSMGCNVEKSVCNICKNAATNPDDYCQHVRLKGAHFDWIDPKTGRKTSKRSYEDCYGVQFFEISAVFDPADETALIREVRAGVAKEANQKLAQGSDRYFDPPTPDRCPQCDSPNVQSDPYEKHIHCPDCGYEHGEDFDRLPGGHDFYARIGQKVAQNHMRKLAEAPLPQVDMNTAPEAVDTMREEEVCPVCGSSMEGGHQCEVCGYVAPPEGLDNPDLEKSKQNVEQNLVQNDGPEQEGFNDPRAQADAGPPPNQIGNPPSNLQPAAGVTSAMSWEIFHPKLAGRINPVEKPIRSGAPPVSNEPKETVISDQTVPVTSRTAASMIAAVNQGEHMSDSTRTADAASGAPEAATPDKRVDATGVGGVLDGSNEQASKADAQIDVEGVGGTGVEGVSADEEESIDESAEPGSDDSGFNKDKTTEDSGPTKTFGDRNQKGNKPVTTQPFPDSSEGVKKSHDDAAFPEEDGGLAGGSAEKGTQPADPVGKADDRVNVLEHVTSPSNNSGPTKTWSGTDGNGVTKQQPPVTRDVVEYNTEGWTSSVVTAIKLADLEVEMGLIEPEAKYDRLSELQGEEPVVVATTLKTLARVRTAGLRKNASTRQGGVGRVPSFRQASAQPPVLEADESLFM